MFGEVLDQIGTQFTLLEFSFAMLTIGVVVVMLLEWRLPAASVFSWKEWQHPVMERSWFGYVTALAGHVLISGLRGGAYGFTGTALLLVAIYLFNPELGAARG